MLRGSRAAQGSSQPSASPTRPLAPSPTAAAPSPPCSDFTPTCLAHPDTYLNKVVVGSADGRLQLWNFSTARLLYTFPGWGSAVRCLVPSPALDVVGVGLGDG